MVAGLSVSGFAGHGRIGRGRGETGGGEQQEEERGGENGGSLPDTWMGYIMLTAGETPPFAPSPVLTPVSVILDALLLRRVFGLASGVRFGWSPKELEGIITACRAAVSRLRNGSLPVRLT